MRKHVRATAALALVLLGAAAASAQAPNAFTIGNQFSGSTFGQSGFIPPDTMGAIGPNNYVELINGRFQRFSRAGASQQATSLDTFWNTALTAGGGGSVTGFSFDPRVMYDRHSGRWFAAAVDSAGNSTSGILIGVTTGNDPSLANWRAFRLDADANNLRWADYPTLGMNGNWVTVTNNMFGISGGTSSSISVLTIPKSSLTAGAPSTAGSQYLVDTTANPANPLVNAHGFVLHPVYDYSNNSPGTGYLLSRYNDTNLQRSTLTGALNTPTLTGNNFVTTANRAMPDINAPQSGANDNIDAGDNRFSGSPVLVNGKIWGVHTFSNGGIARAVVYRLNAATNALEYEQAIDNSILSNDNLWTYYHSIAVNELGQIALAFSGSDNNTFVSTYAIGGYFDGTNVTWGSEVLLQAGAANYVNLDGIGRNRWGDYSAVQVDPNDPFSFWVIQEYANATNSWQTRVTQLNFTAIPEPTTLLLIGGAGAGAYWLRRRRQKQAAEAIAAAQRLYQS